MRRVALLAVGSVLVMAACGATETDEPSKVSLSTTITTLGTTTTTTVALPDPHADLVLHGGIVVAVDPGAPVAEALAILDGRIVVVGSDDEALARAGPAPGSWISMA